MKKHIFIQGLVVVSALSGIADASASEPVAAQQAPRTGASSEDRELKDASSIADLKVIEEQRLISLYRQRAPQDLDIHINYIYREIIEENYRVAKHLTKRRSASRNHGFLHTMRTVRVFSEVWGRSEMVNFVDEELTRYEENLISGLEPKGITKATLRHTIIRRLSTLSCVILEKLDLNDAELRDVLIIASMFNDLKVVKALQLRGVDLSRPNVPGHNSMLYDVWGSGRSPNPAAALEIAKLILASGANVEEGFALEECLRYGDSDILRTLVKMVNLKEAQISNDGRTAETYMDFLLFHLDQSHFTMLEEVGIYYSIYSYAATGQDDHVLKLLNEKHNKLDLVKLMRVCLFHDRKELIVKILKAKDYEAHQLKGFLDAALRDGRLEMVKICLAHGAVLTKGVVPEKGKEQLEYGAYLGPGSSLTIAVAQGELALIKFLVEEKKQSLCSASGGGFAPIVTPLNKALWNKDIVPYLLKNKATLAHGEFGLRE